MCNKLAFEGVGEGVIKGQEKKTTGITDIDVSFTKVSSCTKRSPRSIVMDMMFRCWRKSLNIIGGYSGRALIL